MNRQELIRREVDKIIEWGRTNGFGTETAGRWPSTSLWQPNIRMDWECPGPEFTDDAWNEFAQEMVKDLDDMIENGDTSHTTDPLLKVFDGEIKRGKPLKDLIIHSVMFYQEYNTRRDSTEMTVFIQPHLFWD